MGNVAQYFLMFFLGLQTALTPCYLPVFPVFLALSTRKNAKTWQTGIFFSVGVVLSFILYGVLLVVGGGIIRIFLTSLNQQFVNIALGIVLIALGISLLTPLREFFTVLPSATPVSKVSGRLDSLIFGFFFSLAAAPCAAALMTAALSQVFLYALTSLFEPLLLMLLYGLGTATPFLVIGVLGDLVKTFYRGKSLRNFFLKHSETISGGLLIIFGVFSIYTIENFDVILPVVSRSLLPVLEIFLFTAIIYYAYSQLKVGFYLEASELTLGGAGFLLASFTLINIDYLNPIIRGPPSDKISFLLNVIGTLGKIFLLASFSLLAVKTRFLEVVPIGIPLKTGIDALLFFTMLPIAKRDKEARFLLLFVLYLLLKDVAMLLPDYIYVLSAVFAIESGLGVFLAGRRLSTKYTVLKLYQEV